MRAALRHLALWLDLERLRSLQDRVEAWHAWVVARLGYPWLKAHFRERTGYDLNLDQPRTMNEKVNWQKVHDRRPVFRTILDKYAVRHYVARRIGKDRAEGLFPPLLGVTRKPTADWLREVPPKAPRLPKCLPFPGNSRRGSITCGSIS
ncbi:hypothetical protein E7811_03670 [Aliigemmobacter aestuarii]|uniref:Uncharacterized protein n=1 Tax=Aliigemmobacter aestuarii TaxID=1445661 RepID=A0A4S3MQP8_9RHOB|nr:hypothetical protein [Gemmobacter aestuarii]THD84836.1 hypothetical protein E7811_03670 [Gemmobacter aestuarii]